MWAQTPVVSAHPACSVLRNWGCQWQSLMAHQETPDDGFHVRLDFMWGWISCEPGFHVKLEFMWSWNSCKAGFHTRLDFMWGWISHEAGFHMKLDFIQGWVSCEHSVEAAGVSSCESLLSVAGFFSRKLLLGKFWTLNVPSVMETPLTWNLRLSNLLLWTKTIQRMAWTTHVPRRDFFQKPIAGSVQLCGLQQFLIPTAPCKTWDQIDEKREFF